MLSVPLLNILSNYSYGYLDHDHDLNRISFICLNLLEFCHYRDRGHDCMKKNGHDLVEFYFIRDDGGGHLDLHDYIGYHGYDHGYGHDHDRVNDDANQDCHGYFFLSFSFILLFV